MGGMVPAKELPVTYSIPVTERRLHRREASWGVCCSQQTTGEREERRTRGGGKAGPGLGLEDLLPPVTGPQVFTAVIISHKQAKFKKFNIHKNKIRH